MFRRDIDQLGFHDVSVIAYIREPASHYLAHVQQHLRGSSQVPSPETWFYDPFEHLQRWQKHFDDVRAYGYVRDKLLNRDVVADFINIVSKHFDVALDPEEFKIEAENVSLSAEGMIVLQEFRKRFHTQREGKITKDTDKVIEVLRNSVAEIAQTKPALRPELADIIRFNHAEFLRQLKVHFGVDFEQPEVRTKPQLEGEGREYAVADIIDQFNPAVVDRLRSLVVTSDAGEEAREG